MTSLAVTTLQTFLTLVPNALMPRSLFGISRKDDDEDSRSNSLEEVLEKVVFDTRNDTDSLTTRCYGIYGCFSIDQPYFSMARPINVFPLPVQAITPKFCLYTRDYPDVCQRLHVMDPKSIAVSHFKFGKGVKILTHGYLEHGETRWLKKMVQEYLLYDDHNVIVLDWLSGSGPPYTQTVANIRLIGAITGRFILDLRDFFGVSPSHVHMVGHSLGAHLAGYTGEYLKTQDAKLGRITGLDPAEPYFEGTDPIVRLDPSDADFVDVIHTDGGPIITGGLGLASPVGHFDFYPNGGVRMPGCGHHFIDSVAMEQGNIPYGLRRFIGCNHIRSYEYFTESINSDCPFLSIQCASWEAYWRGFCWQCGDDWAKCNRMGAHADSYLNYTGPGSVNTKMYLITGAESPFCTFHHRISVAMSYTREARLHGGDIGVFFVSLFGERGIAHRQQLNLEEIFFEPGNVYTFMIGTPDLGEIKWALLEWTYVTALYNPLTWRFLSQPSVYVNRIIIDSIEMQQRYEFCGLDQAFRSGTRRKLEPQESCPEQARPPGASILGTIINFDVEDTINNNIDAVNSGLTSLGNGQLLNNLASSANQVAREIMDGARRRMGQERMKWWMANKKMKNRWKDKRWPGMKG
ncbi:pancreatic triacylglycerol lipase-like isoform X3 [Macrobrachium nipponense]|uniref:pancreatic triacylglycerol lipase-like isoform X3 n=1 Tax=Macrobrachium nipponense TaxID=159736 RepID=UPI0030C826D8